MRQASDAVAHAHLKAAAGTEGERLVLRLMLRRVGTDAWDAVRVIATWRFGECGPLSDCMVGFDDWDAVRVTVKWRFGDCSALRIVLR